MNLILAFLINFSPLQDSVVTKEAIDAYNYAALDLIFSDVDRCIAKVDSAIKASKEIGYLFGEAFAQF